MSTSKHLKQVKRQLYKNLLASYRGWWQWHRICKVKGMDQTAVVLIPGYDSEVSYMALAYLDDLLQSRNYKNAIVLTHDKAVEKSASLFSRNILQVRRITRKNAEDLMQFYCLYDFDKRFICASIDEPNGRNGDKLIGKKGTTKEEVFVIGIYRLYPFVCPQTPSYDGKDSDIINFLKGIKQDDT